jgi:hypothetical protein
MAGEIIGGQYRFIAGYLTRVMVRVEG